MDRSKVLTIEEAYKVMMTSLLQARIVSYAAEPKKKQKLSLSACELTALV